MKLLILTLILLFSIPAFTDYIKRKIEYKAINLVIQRYGRGLLNRLKGTNLNPSYRSWFKNEFFVSVAAGTYQEYNWSALDCFSVNICSDSAEKLEVE